jgi:hypothetical protein
MGRDDILNVIVELSYSQGFYGRLLRDILELRDGDPDGYEELMTALEAKNFSEPLDVVLFFET